MRIVVSVFLLLLFAVPVFAAERPPLVVAGENFYGEIAAVLVGDAAAVRSILNDPSQDPHLFEASASTARALADAKIVIYNGLDYDPWMEKMLAAAKRPQRQVIVVADLLGRKSGDNPHLWYDPATMPVAVKAVADALVKVGETGIDRRRDELLASFKTLDAKIVALRQAYAGAPVTATEPVFGYMAQALGLDMRHRAFQFAVMNGTEPSARDVAAMEKDLRGRAVKVLFYNDQKTDPAAERLLRLAREAKVPVVGVAELQPKGTSYVDWMIGQLDALEKALAAKP
jgi:zinc/manganese transport system substrate-binding protein